MRVFVLGSGSTGNLTLLEAPCGARLVLDAGYNPTQAVARMRALGADLFTLKRGTDTPSGIMGVVLTHHHGDHAAHAQGLARAFGAPLYMHAGISMSRVRGAVTVREYKPGVPLALGPFVLDALMVPHDAPQVALRVSAGTRAFGLATDLGHAPSSIDSFLGACDLALVEANHCPRMLEAGPYPPHLKRRVFGPLGHLANEQTADLARRLLDAGLGRLVLGHVSRSNNTPERALDVVRSRAKDLPVEVLPHGVPRAYDLITGHRRARQLDLAL